MTLQVQQELATLVLETFISPCFLKLAIIPTIIIVRIYYKDITTVSDPCSSPALMDRHNFTQLPLSLCHFGSAITWGFQIITLPSAL